MRNKFLASLIVVIMLVGIFAGCTKDDSVKQEEATKAPSASEEVKEAEETAEVTVEEPVNMRYVNFAQNFTDIDDKMISRAKEEGVTVKELAAKFIKAYEKDAKALNVQPADFRPRATEHIGDIIKMIKNLESKGLAYKTDDGVYFDTMAYEKYGKLSGRKIEDMKSGARVKVDENKKAPSDFALWKSEKPGEPSWGSPWGKGRPGWHIECSAMSMKYLGETFDIHGGGTDLIFPHHENEIAQSEGTTGKPFVNYWMHNGHINVNNEKMSKSLGNFFTIPDIAEKFDLEVLRFFMLSVHYRSQVNFSFELMEQANQGLNRLYTAKMRWEDMAKDGQPSAEMQIAVDKAKGIVYKRYGQRP